MCHLVDPWSQSWVREHFFLRPNHNGNLVENQQGFCPDHIDFSFDHLQMAQTAHIFRIHSVHEYYRLVGEEPSTHSFRRDTEDRNFSDLNENQAIPIVNDRLEFPAVKMLVHRPNFETMDLLGGTWKSLFLFTVVKHKGGTITS